MNTPNAVRFYLEEGLRDSATAGAHNFIGKVAKVLNASGLEPCFLHGSTINRAKGALQDGYTLTHMKPPIGPDGLTFRRVYHYPFWQIDQTEQRWQWDTATSEFPEATIEPKEAKRFYHFWQKRLFGDVHRKTGRDGFVYMPLQGRLADHRSFQTCSPLDMIRRTRDAWPDRPLIVTLHPKEVYTAAELAALDEIETADPKIEIRLGQMEQLLPRCDVVVTQNSSAAFNGYFFGKPAILFGQIDFHHIALPGADADSFDRITDHRPDYAKFIWWFWQHECINAGHPSAEAKIAARLRRFGWPIK